MIKIDELMRKLLSTALQDGIPCLLGTVSKDGHPQISPKGSVAVYGDDTLCYWERSRRTAHRNIGANPNVVVYYRNAARAKELPYRAGIIRFHGTARIVRDGPECDHIWSLIVPAEQKSDPNKTGVGVLVALRKIEEISGNVLMEG